MPEEKVLGVLIKCSDCGTEDRIHFKPQGDRPVFCRACFAKKKGGGV